MFLPARQKAKSKTLSDSDWAGIVRESDSENVMALLPALTQKLPEVVWEQRHYSIAS